MFLNARANHHVSFQRYGYLWTARGTTTYRPATFTVHIERARRVRRQIYLSSLHSSLAKYQLPTPPEGLISITMFRIIPLSYLSSESFYRSPDKRNLQRTANVYSMLLRRVPVSQLASPLMLLDTDTSSTRDRVGVGNCIQLHVQLT